MHLCRSRIFAALALAASLSFASGSSLGQTAPAATNPAGTSSSSEPQKLESFVVTGSYIPSTEGAVEAGASPVVKIDRLEIEKSGMATTAELLQSITASNAGSVPISNNALGFTPGASAISLRGLGPEATLVLINGRRVAPYPIGVGGSTAFVDLNSIPLSAIENIEVLKDGASALYGADAVAGVINIRLRRGIQGTEAFTSYGNTVHRDSSEVVASVATGVNTPKLSLTVGVNYYRRAAIQERDRAYSAVAPLLSANSSPMNLELTRFAVAGALGQAISAPIPGTFGRGIFYGQSGADANNTGARPASGYTYSLDRSSTFNPNQFVTSYPESERAGVFAFGEHKLFGTDNVKAYGDFSYQNVITQYQLAPAATGDFSTPFQVDLVIPARTANPILSVINPFLGLIQQVPAGLSIPAGWIPGPGTRIVNGTAQRLATAGASNPFNPFNQDISDTSRGRLFEFGNRVIRSRTDAAMGAVGVKGDNIAGRWNFDASFSYSSIRERTRSTMVSATRFNELVNANSPVFDPRSGSYLGTTTPYNPFGYYQSPIAGNAAVANYGRVAVKDLNESTLGQFSAVLSTSDLFKLPYGSVGVALGADFRHERLTQHPDPLGMAGDVVGSAPTAVTAAQRKIAGVFLEARVPLLPRLEASASVRHEIFFTSDDEVTVPKVGLRYQPIARQLTLRASYSKGFREPSLYERYSSPISILSAIADPRDGFVEPEMPVTLRGNRRLEPEKTDYANVGFVLSPTIPKLKGLTLGADYWFLNRKNTVEANPQYTVYRAFGLLPGGLQPGENVYFSSSGEINLVNAVFFNVGRTRAAGWDFSGSYQLPTDRFGRWELTTVWTLMTQFERASVRGAPLVSVLGRDSTGVGADGYLKWKGRVNLGWSYKGYGVNLTGNYTDGFDDEDASGNPFRVKSSFLVNAQVAYSFRNNHGFLLRDTKVTIGVHNLFDRDPPLALGGGGNTTGYPGFLYTAENQFWYLSLSRKF